MASRPCHRVNKNCIPLRILLGDAFAHLSFCRTSPALGNTRSETTPATGNARLISVLAGTQIRHVNVVTV
jgi:hypothetical protein